MSSSNWKNVEGVPYEWAEPLNTIMKNVPSTPFAGNTIYIASDYSGTQKESKYSVISILLVDLDNSPEWEQWRKYIRKSYLPNGRRMSYKNLKDRIRQEALPIFLSAAGTIRGLLVSIVIDKNIKGLITTRHLLPNLRESLKLKGRWNIYEFEKMARTAFFVSFFIAGLVRPNQNIIWISDEDDIFANPDVKNDTARITSSFTSSFIKHKLGDLGIGTTGLDPGDRLEEDFAAIPDLIAGSLADFITISSNSQGWPLDEGTASSEIKNKSHFILSWLAKVPKNLKNVEIIFEKNEEGKLVIFPLELE